jgi:hypothetical protein
MPAPRNNSYEQASAAAQRAVKNAGGVAAVANLLVDVFPDNDQSASKQRASLEESKEHALSEIRRLTAEMATGVPRPEQSYRVSELHATVRGALSDLETLQRESTARSERRAQALVMEAMAGDAIALTKLLPLAARVSSAFEAAIRAANT